MSSGRYRPIAAGFASIALIVSSTAAQATATTAAVAQSTQSAIGISPWVALSAFGTPAAVTTLCSAGAATAAQGAAVAQATGQQGCVLPVTDMAPVPVVDTTPPPPLPVASGGIGIWPLLLALAGIAAAILLLRGDGDDEPVSP